MGNEAAAVSQEIGRNWNVLNQGYVIRFVLGIYQLSQSLVGTVTLSLTIYTNSIIFIKD